MIPESLLIDLHPGSEAIQDIVTEGLSKPQKQLPPKLFYDERGSKLFNQICELAEYYPTRTELSILSENMPSIVETLGQSLVLVEYGSGSSLKTRLLLNNLKDIQAYIPIDISKEHLFLSAIQINTLFPELRVLPVCADYSQRIDIQNLIQDESRIVAYFPGSSIGNFEREHARSFLRRVNTMIGKGGSLLIGVDLVKDANILEQAYNDKEGITAQFNLNILSHINSRLGIHIDPAGFRHRAVYNADMARIEMYLDAISHHSIEIGDRIFEIEQGESILTEYSHKYTIEDFSSLARNSGFSVEHIWMDSNKLFSIQYLSAL